MTHRDVVDLYAIRCAVAALVHARHHIDQLAPTHIARLDTAVRHLADIAGDLNGDLATAVGWLLAPDADIDGQRTVHAIDRLAALTHVDPAAAPALAASLRGNPRPHQPTLFDPNSPVPATA